MQSTGQSKTRLHPGSLHCHHPPPAPSQCGCRPTTSASGCTSSGWRSPRPVGLNSLAGSPGLRGQHFSRICLPPIHRWAYTARHPQPGIHLPPVCATRPPGIRLRTSATGPPPSARPPTAGTSHRASPSGICRHRGNVPAHRRCTRHQTSDWVVTPAPAPGHRLRHRCYVPAHRWCTHHRTAAGGAGASHLWVQHASRRIPPPRAPHASGRITPPGVSRLFGRITPPGATHHWAPRLITGAAHGPNHQCSAPTSASTPLTGAKP